MSTKDWFGEIHKVLDAFRCAVLHVLDNDKGVHLYAAVNLCVADGEPAVTGIRLAKAQVARQAGCTIGMATG